MDPNVALIVGALVAGVAETATQAVKDAYAGLRKLLAARFAGDGRAEQTMADHESDPETYEKPMAKQLEVTGVATDPAVVAAAELVKRAATEAGTAGLAVKYWTNVSGRAAVGDGATYQERSKSTD